MKTLAEKLLEVLVSSPERTALVLQHAGRDDVHVSCADLLRGAEAYAAEFSRREVLPGDVVILILQHGQDLIYAFWGAILHGAIPSIMPFLTEKLSPEQYRMDLATLLSITKPAAIVTFPDFEAEVRSALPEQTTVRCVITGADAANPFAASTVSRRSVDDLVLLQHSSGTTGLRKGVALSHRAVQNQLASYGLAIELNVDDVVVSWLPLYHDMGLIAGFIMPIVGGVKLVLSSPFDWVRAPWRLLRAVSKYRGTLSWLPNFSYNFLAQKTRDRDLEGVDLTSWRAVINCSEPVRLESHRAFFNRFEPYGLHWEALQTCYAMAENVFGVTQSALGHEPVVRSLDRELLASQRVAEPIDPGDPGAVLLMSSGRPIANTEVRIVDDDTRPVAEGGVGEIALRSDCMLTGYYNRSDADEKALRDGWFLTGDYGFLLDGEVFVSGRKRDLIIVGGKNIYPQDLEALSYDVPGVHAGRSVAFGVYNAETGTEDVFLIAEVDMEDAAEQDRVADQIRKRVSTSSAIALRHVKVVGPRWILKTSSGKTARAANRLKFLKELGIPDSE